MCSGYKTDALNKTSKCVLALSLSKVLKVVPPVPWHCVMCSLLFSSSAGELCARHVSLHQQLLTHRSQLIRAPDVSVALHPERRVGQAAPRGCMEQSWLLWRLFSATWELCTLVAISTHSKALNEWADVGMRAVCWGKARVGVPQRPLHLKGHDLDHPTKGKFLLCCKFLCWTHCSCGE